MDNYFSSHYAKVNQIDLSSEESIRRWFHASIEIYKREFLPYAGNLQNKKILELGCGIGGILNFLKSRNINNYLGVDSSQEQLAICKTYVTDKVILSSAEDFIGSSKDKFDIIIMYDLIEHLKKQNIQNLLNGIYKNLNGGGKLLVRTPNMGYLFAAYSRYIDFTHEIGFTEESISQVLRVAGFDDISIENNYIGEKRKWINTKIYRLIRFLFNYRVPKIVTSNLIAIAIKK